MSADRIIKPAHERRRGRRLPFGQLENRMRDLQQLCTHAAQLTDEARRLCAELDGHIQSHDARPD